METLAMTGASGFIGRVLAERLLTDGYDLRLLARTPEKVESFRTRGATVIEGDLTDPDSVRRTVSGTDGVVHLAAVYRLGGDLDWMRTVNVEGTKNVLDAARREGRIGVVLGAQNAAPIEDDVGLIQVLNDAGLAVMQLTYNNLSLLGAGCAELDDPGVSRMGREAIAEMNRVGMAIDLSHAGARTAREAIELSGRPVAITHANPRFFHDIARNLPDEVLRTLGARGGMLGLSLYPPHMPDGAETTLQAFTDMVARTVELTGVGQIGIGSDSCRGWDGRTLDYMRNGRWRFVPEAERQGYAATPWPKQPPGFDGPADMPKLAQGLRARGFDADEVDAIMGGNWARFFRNALEPAG